MELNSRLRIHVGDCLEILATMEPDSIDCVVTSPPYWGLRDYGTATWEGGDTDCDHKKVIGKVSSSSTLRRDGRKHLGPYEGEKALKVEMVPYKETCGKCGAVRIDRQLGLEPTLAEHIIKMVEVFEAVRRVLKPGGTVWLNYGDCYATSANGRSAADTKATGNDDRTFRDKPFSTIGGALKPKDLCMVPNRLAIALQEAGWWVRSEIIWGKPNPMPESVTDRPATAHEKIFMLTKSARYWYDKDAVRQGLAKASVDRIAQDVESQKGSGRANGGSRAGRPMKAVMPAEWAQAENYNDRDPRYKKRDKQRGHSKRHAGFNDRWDKMPVAEQRANGRNLRNYEPAPVDVWNIATHPFSEAHFATFPPALAERCILAGCPKGGVVLDPFGGSGTTALVALRLGRRAELIELNPEYAEMARRRIEKEWRVAPKPAKPDYGPLFAEKDVR